MAPLVVPGAPALEHIRQVPRAIPSSFSERPNPRHAWLFPSAIDHITEAASTQLIPRDLSSEVLSAAKRQQTGILAIPTTYAGLNAGPAPGSVVGVVLGSVGGFLLALFIVYSIVRFSGRWGSGRVVEEEIITRRRSRSSRSSPSESEMVEVEEPPPRRERRRRTREETVVVEEQISEPEDDIVEVIEEHSPERRPSKKSQRTSGFRTVDPAELGGGGRPMRNVSKR